MEPHNNYMERLRKSTHATHVAVSVGVASVGTLLLTVLWFPSFATRVRGMTAAVAETADDTPIGMIASSSSSKDQSLGALLEGVSKDVDEARQAGWTEKTVDGTNIRIYKDESDLEYGNPSKSSGGYEPQNYNLGETTYETEFVPGVEDAAIQSMQNGANKQQLGTTSTTTKKSNQ